MSEQNSETKSISRADANAVDRARCRARIWDRFRFIGCTKRATRDGYCGTHHPDAVAARKARSDARYTEKLAAFNAKWAAQKEQRRRAECFDDMLTALRQIAAIEDRYHGGDWDEINEAREIARAAIAKATGNADARAEGTRQHATKSTDADVDAGNAGTLD